MGSKAPFNYNSIRVDQGKKSGQWAEQSLCQGGNMKEMPSGKTALASGCSYLGPGATLHIATDGTTPTATGSSAP